MSNNCSRMAKAYRYRCPKCHPLPSCGPRTIWYSFRPNHDETTLITKKQNNLPQESPLIEIFWQASATPL